MKSRTILALVAGIALLFAACGSDSVEADDAAELAADQAAEAELAESDDAAMADEDPADDAATAADDPADDPAEDDAMADDDPADDAAMADEDPAEDEATADDEGGDHPSRIVSINPTGTEMLFAVGAGDQVVAVDSFSYFPADAPVVEDLSAFAPSIEMIATFEPDLVVTSGPVEGLDALGVEILELPAVVDLDGVYAQIEQVGAVTGNVGGAAEVVLRMQTEIEAVLASLPERETPLTYYHELDNTLFSVTSSTFIGYVYSLLGLENVADAADPDGEFFGYPQLNSEFLLTADPDIIFLADTLCCEQTAETVAQRAGWEALRAVENGNVVELNDDVVSRWGPRLVEFIQLAGEAVAAIETAPAG